MAIKRLLEQSVANKGLGKPGAFFVGATSAFATGVTLPVHQTGDILVVWARSNGFNITPALPTGWTNITTTGSFFSISYGNVRMGYLIATSSSMTSGTWTGATALIAVCLRRATGIGGFSMSGSTSGTNIAAPAITNTGTGKSVLLYFYGWGSPNTGTSVGTVPTGYTRRFDGLGNSGLDLIACNTKNDTTIDGSIIQPATFSGYQVHSTLEVLGA